VVFFFDSHDIFGTELYERIVSSAHCPIGFNRGTDHILSIGSWAARGEEGQECGDIEEIPLAVFIEIC